MDTNTELSLETLMATAETMRLKAETAKINAEIAKLEAERQLAKVKAVCRPFLVIALVIMAISVFGYSFEGIRFSGF